MIEITLVEVQVGVMDVTMPDGSAAKVLRAQDQNGIVVTLPLTMAGAVQIGNALCGRGVVVPSPIIPPTPPGGLQA